MKRTLEIALIGLTITFITACGGVPLAQPERNASAVDTPVEEATKAVVIVQPQSPLAPPTPAKESTVTSATPSGPGVEILEIVPLTFDDTTPAGQELRALLNTQKDWSYAKDGGDGPFHLLGWTPAGEVVVQPIIPNTQQAERPVWAINPTNGLARPLPDWNLEPVLTETQQQMVDNFLAQRQSSPKIVRPYPSPGNEYLAIAALEEDKSQNKLYVYRAGEEKELAVLPQATDGTLRAVTNFPPVWSPDGRKLAYGVAVYKGDDDFTPASYELHISEPATNHFAEIELVYPHKGNSKYITWSPDSRYVVFSAQRSEQGPVSLFVVNVDGTGLADLMPETKYWALDLVVWSHDGTYIAHGPYGTGIVWLYWQRS